MNTLANLLSERLLQWYAEHKRDLPWRHTKDPYLIWLSEVILQQTRVQQGLPYYERFAEHYPTVFDLANAPETEVLRIWQGLGYYSRARNLHAAAKQVANEFGGVFPTNYAQLQKLKGVGDYTAAAIASFAYNESVAVLDGNVFRVLARIFGVADDIASHAGKKKFAELAQSLVPEGHASVYNQAIMEFGALHCKPANPLCASCVFNTICVAYAEGRQQELPVKAKKAKVKERHFQYAVFTHGGQVLMRPRGAGDIWQGLYDCYCEETDQSISTEEMLEKLLPLLEDKQWTLLKVSATHKHLLTHQRIFMTFFHIEMEVSEEFMGLAKKINLEICDFNRWQELPKPILLATYLHSSVNWLNFAINKA